MLDGRIMGERVQGTVLPTSSPSKGHSQGTGTRTHDPPVSGRGKSFPWPLGKRDLLLSACIH